ncbi:helix-turn-helix transcriptional regulator [Gordonibacter urolithinfaciens]|uniref:helix-turn-helix transcriptional regulator n=1 Tax=Gordonibacter urolithinfaciens TaxID=1335613 RepID=UPI001D070F5B|nr:helix-turn-helix domain-containing protein [Gordonibacter urolithinfaciens]
MPGKGRAALKEARKSAGMTQQAVADKLGISLRHYQQIEYSEVLGAIWIWDALEDLFGVHQRKLRWTQDTNLVRRANPKGRLARQQ